MRPLHSRLTLATVLLAALIFVGVRSLGTSSGRLPPDPAPSPFEDSPVPMPEPLAGQAIPVQRAAPAGPQPTGAAIRLDILGDDSFRLSGQPVRAEDLAWALAFLADEDRGGSTRNRVSRRELLVRAPADLPWASVRRILLAAAGPPVGIHRIFLALPQGTPVSVSVEPGWIAAEQDDEIGRWIIDAPISVELRRDSGAKATQLILLGREIGTGTAAFADLESKCIKIRSSPGNSTLCSELKASSETPFGEVHETLRMLWRVGHPAVFVFCLMPPHGNRPIGTYGWNLAEEAALLSGEKRIGFLLDQLWSRSDLAADKAEYLLLDEGAAALPRLIARMESEGLPPRERVSVVDCPCGRVGPDTALLHSFGATSVPILIEAASSRSPQVRAIVVRALGGFPEAGPEVEETIRRMADQDPDPEPRRQARAALVNLRATHRPR